MDTELRCSICKDYFTEPVMLQCTHRICVDHLATHGSQGQLACPVCAQLTLLPPEGSLRVDRTLQLVVDLHRESQETAETGDAPSATLPTCGFCEERPATRHCIQCSGVLCKECEKTEHSKKFFKGHYVVDISDQVALQDQSQWSARMLCDEHPEEKLRFYCLDCRLPVCAHCLIMGEHKGHQNSPIDQAAQSGKDTLNAWVEKLKQRLQAAEALLERLGNDAQEVQRNAEVQRNTINTELDHLRELLETKRHQLLSKSALEEQQKRVPLQAQVDRTEAVRSDSSTLVGRSQVLLELDNDHAFLAVLLGMIQDMKGRASQPVDTSQHVSCTFRPLSTDAQARSLGDLDLGQPRLTAALDASVPGRLQSMAFQHVAHVATQPGLLAAAAPGGLAPQYEGLSNAYQVPAAADAAIAQKYSVLPPGSGAQHAGQQVGQHAGQHATVSCVGSYQLPPGPAQAQAQQLTQSQQLPQSAHLGQAGVTQSIYIYRSVHQG